MDEMTTEFHNQPLTLELLLREAAQFAAHESTHDEPNLYGVTDGKAVGTYLEQKFRLHLLQNYTFVQGNSAAGIDFPGLGIDMKVTSVRQPQSSCPYSSARQKIYGLGYGLLVFVYDKSDDRAAQTSRLNILHTIYIAPERTGDYQMTRGIRQLLANDANQEDLVAFMLDRNLPVDEIAARNLAEELLLNPPSQGYLTISNALQWRLQYGRAISQAGLVDGVYRVQL